MHKAPQFHRHRRFDVEPDHGAAPAALERGFKQPHQVFRFFQDFDFEVADNAKCTHALHGVAGKQFADEQARGCLDRDQSHFAAVAGLRQPHEAFDAVGHADQRVHRLAVLGARKLQGDREAKVGNKRERMRRVDGKRRQQRKNVGKKVIFEPGLVRPAEGLTVDHNDAGVRKRRPQLAPLRLLIFDQDRHGLGNANELLGGGQSLGTLGADAFAQLRAEAGDAHHEEFIEVVGRDRQEFQPLKERIFGVGQFLKHATVEIQPRQLPVDETIRTGGKLRPGLARRLIGRPRRLFQAPRGTRFTCNSSGLATIGHGRSVLLKRYVRHRL